LLKNDMSSMQCLKITDSSIVTVHATLSREIHGELCTLVKRTVSPIKYTEPGWPSSTDSDHIFESPASTRMDTSMLKALSWDVNR